jgi:hypothetical protein
MGRRRIKVFGAGGGGREQGLTRMRWSRELPVLVWRETQIVDTEPPLPKVCPLFSPHPDGIFDLVTYGIGDRLDPRDVVAVVLAPGILTKDVVTPVFLGDKSGPAAVALSGFVCCRDVIPALVLIRVAAIQPPT